MKVKQFLGYLNFNSTDWIEVCDVNISLDNRTRLTSHDIVDSVIAKGLGGKFADMTLQSFTAGNGKLTMYVK